MKNINIGIDIVDVNKFREIPFKSKPGFYKKLFTESEIKYCLKYKNYFEHFAAKFAIKEAVKKTISKKIKMIDIETFHKKSIPHVRLKSIHSKYVFSVSVSHEKDIAIAVVISELLD